MERSAEAIGKREFDDVWERVVSDASLQPAAENRDGVITVPEPSAQGILPAAVSKATPEVNRAAAPLRTFAEPAFMRSACVEPILPAAVSDEELYCLREIMEAVAATKRECCAVAACTRGRVRRVCRAIENSCRCSIAELNTQYYMQTGESFCPGSSVAPVSNVSDTLRDVCNNEAAVRDACVRLAEQTGNAALENALLRCANCAARRERACESLLADMLQGGCKLRF